MPESDRHTQVIRIIVCLMFFLVNKILLRGFSWGKLFDMKNIKIEYTFGQSKNISKITIYSTIFLYNECPTDKTHRFSFKCYFRSLINNTQYLKFKKKLHWLVFIHEQCLQNWKTIYFNQLSGGSLRKAGRRGVFRVHKLIYRDNGFFV